MPTIDRLFRFTFYIALLAYSTVTILSLFGSRVGQFDEAIPLLHGLLVQQGKIPNLDFYSFYPPLNAYVNAAMFTFFGVSVIPARLATSGLYVALLLLTLKVFRSHLRSSHPVLLPALGLLFAASIGAAIALPVFPGLALSLLALLSYADTFEHDNERLWRFALSGALAAVAILYRVNFGGYAVAVISVDLLVAKLRRPGAPWISFDVRKALAFFGTFALGIVVICAFLYGRQSIRAASEFIMTAQKLMALRGFITLPRTASVACALALPGGWFLFRLSSHSNQVPLGGAAAIIATLFLPFLGVIAGSSVSMVPLLLAAEILTVVLLNAFVFRLDRTEFVFLLFFCCLLHYFLSRADWMHWRVLPIGFTLLLCFGLAIASSKSLVFPWTAFAIVVTASFLLFTAEPFRPDASYAKSGAHLLLRFATHPHMTDAGEVLDQSVPAAGWLTVYSDIDELEALRYLREQTVSSDPIFVGVKDHSQLFWNDLLLYWLARRPIGVHTFQLETRIATEQSVQSEIIRDLGKNNVQWLILDQAPQQGDDTFMRNAYHGSTLLDRYISSRFAEAARFGYYSVMQRTSGVAYSVPK